MLNMLKKSSYLISVEGIEGCGKSTLINSLTKDLPTLYPNKTFHYFREPGATLWGEKIRELLLDDKLKRTPMAEVFLFLSSRSQLIQQHLIPLLEQENQVIILDRFSDSTFVYQGYVQGLDIEYLKKLHLGPGMGLTPMRTLYLRISAETSLMRQKIRNQGKDYFEQWGPDKIQKLVHGFDQMAKDEPKRISVINAELNAAEVLEQTLTSLKELIKS